MHDGAEPWRIAAGWFAIERWTEDERRGAQSSLGKTVAGLLFRGYVFLVSLKGSWRYIKISRM